MAILVPRPLLIFVVGNCSLKKYLFIILLNKCEFSEFNPTIGTCTVVSSQGSLLPIELYRLIYQQTKLFSSYKLPRCTVFYDIQGNPRSGKLGTINEDNDDDNNDDDDDDVKDDDDDDYDYDGDDDVNDDNGDDVKDDDDDGDGGGGDDDDDDDDDDDEEGIWQVVSRCNSALLIKMCSVSHFLHLCSSVGSKHLNGTIRGLQD